MKPRYCCRQCNVVMVCYSVLTHPALCAGLPSSSTSALASSCLCLRTCGVLLSVTACYLVSHQSAHLLHAVQEVQLAQSGAVKKPPELKQKYVISKYLGDFNAL